MRYVVTGGAGFIGSHICDVLVRQDHEVVIVDDLSTGRKENIEPLLRKEHVSFIEGSIIDLDLLLESFRGAEGIFHQAALASVPRSIAHPILNHDVNVTGTLNVLLAARDTGPRKVVIASSAAIYGNLPGLQKREDMSPNPLSPYAAAKLMDEYYASVFTRLYGLETVCLRYFNVYGPRQDPLSDYAAVIPKFIFRLMNGQLPVILGDGGQTRDFIFVKDVVRANIQVMQSPATGVYNIASGRETSVNTLAEILIQNSGISGSPKHGQAREGDVYRSYADISKAWGAFEFSPATVLEDGLKETAEWFSGTQGS